MSFVLVLFEQTSYFLKSYYYEFLQWILTVGLTISLKQKKMSFLILIFSKSSHFHSKSIIFLLFMNVSRTIVQCKCPMKFMCTRKYWFDTRAVACIVIIVRVVVVSQSLARNNVNRVSARMSPTKTAVVFTTISANRQLNISSKIARVKTDRNRDRWRTHNREFHPSKNYTESGRNKMETGKISQKSYRHTRRTTNVCIIQGRDCTVV